MSECDQQSLEPPKSGALQSQAVVVSNVLIAAHTFRLRLKCPAMASLMLPGQFLMLRLPGSNDPLLGRPFALYDTATADSGEVEFLDIGYHVVGKQTTLLEGLVTGDLVEIWGPLGNGFPLFTGQHLVCVAGGIGYTPMIAVTQELLGKKGFGGKQPHQAAQRVTIIYGARDQAHLADLHEFKDDIRVDVKYATDDGSKGHHGYVTEVLSELLTQQKVDTVYCCGPEIMMKKVALICQEQEVPCWLSLETPMACGIGACFSCVVKVRDGEGWDYRRSCLEGPVFEAGQLVLE